MTRVTDQRSARLTGGGAFALALSFVLHVSGALAQEETPAPPATTLSEGDAPGPISSADYETALAHALEAHARGDFAAARIFLERAHGLDPSARTLRGLGIVAFSQGRHLAAIRYLDEALTSSAKALTPELRASVVELLTHAWGQVGRFEIAIEPTTGDFLVDDQPADFYAPHTVVLTPGVHLIKARAEGHADYVLKLEVKPGDSRALQIVLAKLPARIVVERLIAAPAAEATSAASLPAFWSKPVRRGTWLGGGLLLGAGIGVYAAAYVRLDSVVERCRDMADGACSKQRAKQLYNQENIKPLAITAVTLLGAGALVCLAAAGIEIGIKLKADKRRGASAGLGLGPSQLFVHGRF